jgi:hypothetical protein
MGLLLRGLATPWSNVQLTRIPCSNCSGWRHWLVSLWAMKRMVLVTAAMAALSIVVIPAAHAEQIVRTESGKVRCAVQADRVGCQYLPGFRQAPVDPSPPCPPPPGTYLRCGGPGIHWDIANVTSGGAFSWMNGNISGAHPENDTVLNYGQSYDILGWTILPNGDGTRFTNDGTGRGMFVSIENVSSF